MRSEFHQCLTFIKEISNINCTFHVIHVSGSIKKCKKYLVDYCEKRLAQLYTAPLKLGDGASTTKSPQSEGQLQNINVLESLVKICEVKDNSFNLVKK
jgi:hypothetical protein